MTTPNIGEARLNQQMLRTAQQTIVLPDSSKFGKRGFGRICEVEQTDHIITSQGIAAPNRIRI